MTNEFYDQCVSAMARLQSLLGLPTGIAITICKNRDGEVVVWTNGGLPDQFEGKGKTLPEAVNNLKSNGRSVFRKESAEP